MKEVTWVIYGILFLIEFMVFRANGHHKVLSDVDVRFNLISRYKRFNLLTLNLSILIQNCCQIFIKQIKSLFFAHSKLHDMDM